MFVRASPSRSCLQYFVSSIGRCSYASHKISVATATPAAGEKSGEAAIAKTEPAVEDKTSGEATSIEASAPTKAAGMKKPAAKGKSAEEASSAETEKSPAKKRTAKSKATQEPAADAPAD